MIQTFRCKSTRALFEGKRVAKFLAIQKVAERKLLMLHAAHSLDFLRSPPGNRLEALRGDLIGHHSIRINDQFRLCFRWIDGDAFDVEIVDYH